MGYFKNNKMADDEQPEVKYSIIKDNDGEPSSSSRDFKGFGKATYTNNDMYEGYYVDGKRHGRGKYTYASDMSVYEGEFVNNLKHGIGRMEYREKGKEQAIGE